MNALLRDVRFALRMLVKSPAYTIVAILTLAVVIGANTAIFSAVNVVLLRPLRYPDPEQLVAIHESSGELEELAVPYSNYLDYRAENTSFSELAAISLSIMTVTGKGGPEPLGIEGLSANYLPMMGISPLLGRNFLPEEDSPAHRVVILSHGLWTRRYAADPALLGRKITLDNHDYTVVGVMAPEYRPFLWPFIGGFVPLGSRADEDAFRDRTVRPELYLYGRLRPDVTLEQARADMRAIGDGLERRFPEQVGASRPLVRPLHAVFVKDARVMLLLLFGAVVCVLLIGAANVANLTLERAMTRRRELGIRAALGAGRWRLIRQMLVESTLLALAGGGLGLLLALWSVDVMNVYRPGGMAFNMVGAIEIDGGVLVFTTVVALATGLLFGLVPALLATRLDLAQVLKNADHHASAGGHHLRARNILVVVEVALALMLAVSATLASRSLAHLHRLDPGFDPHVTFALLNLPPERYPTTKEMVVFLGDLQRRFAAIPGVVSVTAASGMPGFGAMMETFYPLGVARKPENGHVAVSYRADVGFLETLEIPLLAGRTCGPQDDVGTVPVVLVGRRLADKFFPGQDPIGQRLQDTVSKQPSVEIVGVFGDVFPDGPGEPETTPYQLLHCYRQLPTESQQEAALGVAMHVLVRTADAAVDPSAQMRAAAAELDPLTPLWTILSLNDMYEGRLKSREFTARMLGVFAVIALLLAAVGLYAVMANTVAQRTHELGVRLALGAQPRAIVALVVRQGMRLIAVGLGIGIVGALALAHVMTTIVTEGVGATDPVTYIGTIMVLATVGLLATWLPARRTTRIDPMVALRHE